MRIAFASQNRREITDHAGQCRRFWIVDVIDGIVVGRQLIELQREQTFHATGTGLPGGLEGIGVLVAGSMGPGLRQRLVAHGITAVVTAEKDIDGALARFIAGTLADEPAAGHPDSHGEDGHHCGCGHTHH